jgi:ParB family chromosome partitioning protein
MTIQTIALNLLVQSKANVRTTGQKDGIPELAASIAAHGLRQNLNVQPTENDRFEVVAGSRRLRALKLLAKEKKIARNHPVDCLVLDAADNPGEISLVENTLRQPMHPDDQCEAFRKLIEQNALSVEEVAARFGITATVVRQRLKLAHVAPELRALSRKGELTLDHMTALAISDDHVAQIQAWKNLPDWNPDAALIKQYLTQEALPVSHKLVVAAGLESYVAAGGTVLHDLFDLEDEGYATDRALVMRLVEAKLEEAMADLRAEGWKWVTAEIMRDHATPYRRVFPQPVEGEDALAYVADDLARAGARVIVEYNGTLRIERGLIHRDDWEAEEAGEGAPVPSAPKSPADLPASIVEDLTAQRTAALRIELVRNPTVALAATVHTLALSHLYVGYSVDSCLAIRANSERLAGHTTAPEDCAAHAAMEAEAEMWGDRLPGDPVDLWGWCVAQPHDVLLNLLAYVAALSVNAVVQMKHDRPNASRLQHADQLADCLDLRMENWWTGGVSFFERLSKATLAHIVEASGVETGVSISRLKKPEAAKFVAGLLKGAAWLPAPLERRTVEDAEPLSEAA